MQTGKGLTYSARMVELVSTRDPREDAITYEQAILAGLAPDGGLYVPKRYPVLDEMTLQELLALDFVELAVRIKTCFAGDGFSPQDIKGFMERAYSSDKFPHTNKGVVTPVRQVSTLFIQNLSLGPTAAFKDMALQPLGQEMNCSLERADQSLRILGATSGDTGSAAEAALKGLPRIQLFMLSPREGMSEFQRAQMGRLSGGNITNISVAGRFDDCQDLVKSVKADPEFADLGAVNSINFSRISSQVAYYFAAYNQVNSNFGEPVDFVVPSGNFGNVLAGYIARAMGLPIRRLIIATNENSVLHDVIQTGEYRTRQAEITSSPSMDISKASNFERLIYDLLGKDPVRVAAYMDRFAATGAVRFSEFGLSDSVLRDIGFDSGVSTHEDRLDSIRWVHDQGGGIIDPHTADAVTVARRLSDDGVPKICLETALAVKFEPVIQEALGFVPEREERFRGLEDTMEPDAFLEIPADPEILKDIIRSQ